jgi:hypothetical protein
MPEKPAIFADSTTVMLQTVFACRWSRGDAKIGIVTYRVVLLSLLSLLSLLLSFVLVGTVHAASPSASEIEQAAARLGDQDHAVRDDASRLLWDAGKDAEPALRQALSSKDPEIVTRARVLLQNIEYGIRPDTPAEIIELVRRYPSNDAKSKLVIIVKLLKQRSTAAPSICRLWMGEPDEELRRRIFGLLIPHATEFASVFIDEGDEFAAQRLLEIGAQSGNDSAAQSYAAYLHSRGLLDEKIEAYEARIQDPDPERAAKILAYMYRSRGNLDLAVNAAELSGDRKLTRRFKIELEERDGKRKSKDARP